VVLYRQFLQSVNTSLDQTLASDVLRLLPDVPPQLRELAITNRPALLAAVEDYLNERGAQGDEEAGGMLALIREKFDQVEKLKDEGYAPLMRFGRYKVHIVDAEGGTLYFGLYETKTAANRMARELGEDPAFKGARFERGVLSEEQYKLFSGFPLDSLEMFAQAVGADKAEVFAEARSEGFDVKIIRKVIAIRAKDPATLTEEEALVDAYLAALNRLEVAS
jgi:uncharacterized protein (UPF0335 family)